MPVKRSLTAFRKSGKNCAQSILYGFQELLAIADADITAARKLGHGRADKGRCGALHVALQLSPNPKIKEQLKRAFENTAGSEYCREIRTKKQLPCDGCVQLAAAILAQEQRENF